MLEPGGCRAPWVLVLRNEDARLGIADHVHFEGFVRGYEKFERLACMDALFVASDMENFGMIIPEGPITGTPVMASLGTPWQSLDTERCGWWRDNSLATIASVIRELRNLPAGKRREMDCRGRDYILRAFADTHVAAQMLECYQCLAGEAEKPEFVYE